MAPGKCSSAIFQIHSAPSPITVMVKKVVRRAEVKGHRHGFRVSGVLLIEAADNPRPVHKLCHQTQHPKQDHHLESPRARPESLPALSFDSSQQVVQKQEEKQQRRYVVPRPRMLLHGGRSEEHTSELQSRLHLVCRLLLEKKKKRSNPLLPATGTGF